MQRLGASLTKWVRPLAARVVKYQDTYSRILTMRLPASGKYISPDEALKLSAVWACTYYLGSTVGQLPWSVYADETRGGKVKKRYLPNHPVNYLLHTRPNYEMGALQWKRAMVSIAALWGNAIAEIEWDLRGVPIALWPIHPCRVTPVRLKTTGELAWQVTQPEGGFVTLTSENVFHLPGYGDGPIGLSVYQYAADSLGAARAAEIFGGSFFGKGANPSGIVKTKGTLTEGGLAELKAEFENLYTGSDNQQRVMFLDSEMEWTQTSSDPEKSQLILTRQQNIEDVCRWFRVPPHKIMHLLRATFSNIENQSIEVVVDSITPWAISLEQEADFKLLSDRSAAYTKLELKGLLRGDFKSRQEGLQIQRRNGVINANAWRELEDMDDMGPDGDIYIVEGNMTQLKDVGKMVGAPPPAPASQGTQDDPAADPAIAARKRASASLLRPVGAASS